MTVNNTPKRRFMTEESISAAVLEGATPDQVAAALQKQDKIKEHLSSMLSVRVPDPSGPNIKRVNFKEYVEMRQDPMFKSLASYANSLLCYSDGTPRKTPLRPLLQNEVGTWTDRAGTTWFICITDTDPDGVGTVYQVKEQIGGEEK